VDLVSSTAEYYSFLIHVSLCLPKVASQFVDDVTGNSPGIPWSLCDKIAITSSIVTFLWSQSYIWHSWWFIYAFKSKKARQTWQKPDFGDVLNLHKWMATITAGLPVIAVSVIGPSRDWVGGYSGLGQGDYGINQLWARFEAVKITLFLRKWNWFVMFVVCFVGRVPRRPHAVYTWMSLDVFY